MNKEFASDYSRNEHGWIQFPMDRKERKELFTPESELHAAKSNIFLIGEVLEYCTNSGDKILDIFGGTGTLMLGEQIGREVHLIEINPNYIQCIKNNAEKNGLHPVLYEGASQRVLQEMIAQGMQFDLISTSPPYPQTVHAWKDKGDALSKRMAKINNTYVADEEKMPNGMPYNLAQVSDFIYNKEMDKLYKLCYDVLKPGGYISVVIRDKIRAGIRQELGFATAHALSRLGFVMDCWNRWALPQRTWTTQINANKGLDVIDDEHIIVMRK